MQCRVQASYLKFGDVLYIVQTFWFQGEVLSWVSLLSRDQPINLNEGEVFLI